ncbi:MAG: hypothetical protein ABR928_02805 [Terracidiphilus sp.]|jgi:hypothetical protein
MTLLVSSLLIATPCLFAQAGEIQAPQSIEAGGGFSIQTTGNGKATLYIVGPNQVLRRDVERGQTTSFAPGLLHNAGHYLVILRSDNSIDKSELDVTAARTPSELSFLAKPSRLPVGIHDGITGAVYVFDAYKNLITSPAPVSFELSTPSGATQARTVATHDGAAFTAMDSTQEQGADKFVARVGAVTSTRIVGQVPGDPCGIKMTATPSGQHVQLATEPLRDCSGNAIPDGMIVTFTETYQNAQTTVDVPLKKGIAQISMPAHNGAVLSAASGVVMGNQIRLERQ